MMFLNMTGKLYININMELWSVSLKQKTFI